ncbi:MAG TPA: glycosyltransferase family 2 protein, partial [Paracoccaceae bacterium]|nr:glycosyltransferase family 2 protein [Paracoccaceae bacterium]
MPNHTILATMKNEAPFILEWVAYHQIIGFDKFVIFSNDSTDGTTEILDALDRAGIINHYFHQKADSEVLDHSIPKKAADTGAFAND